MRTRSLIAGAIMLIALCAPALALPSDGDKGVAAIIVFNESCGPGVVPAKVMEMAKVYADNRSRQVLSEAATILLDLMNIPNIDSDTAMKMWCAKMRPELPKIFERHGL